jgi:hypothetical protein
MAYIGNQPTTAAFVTDQFSANGSGTVFTLSVAPANTSSILVAVSGVLQDPSTYSVAATTLTFSAAPPAGTGNISVRFLGIPASGVTTTAYRTVTEFTATAGQTTFSVPSYTAGFINVYRNGVMLGTADFTATSGTTVVLATGATAGDLITTESFYVSSVLNAIPATNGAVTSAYIQTGGVAQTNIGTNVGGTGPAFSAYAGSSQSISINTVTKVTLDTETFDTNNNFASSRFTPTVAGYYQINAKIRGTSTSSGMSLLVISIYKNGVGNSQNQFNTNAPVYAQESGLSTLVYLNGTTDYVELYGAIYGSGTPSFNYFSNDLTSAMSGVLVRAA